MYSTVRKTSTLREARASGRLFASSEALTALRDGTVPKGNAVEIARTAGVMAAKRTWELIPYCHPVPIDQILVDIVIESDHILVSTLAVSVARTGLEMEAMTGASMALLTLYDMLKPIDKDMHIESIRLDDKKGGKSQYRRKAPRGLRCWIITTSDGTFAGKREDKSGRILQERMEEFGVTPEKSILLPDDLDQIKAALEEAAAAGVDLVLTTGGTGLGPRDLTVEATALVIDREVPGVGEAMRAHGQDRTPYAMLSRGLCGMKGKTLILNLPGSSKGASESMDAVFPALFHVFPILEGATHDKGLDGVIP